jgi:hypothetical protein
MVLLYLPSLWSLVSNVVGSVFILFLVGLLVLSISLIYLHFWIFYYRFILYLEQIVE